MTEQKNMNIGRPKKYTKEFIDALATDLQAYFDKKENIFLLGFAIEKKLPPEYFAIFARQNKSFSTALKNAKAIQELRLIESGLGKPNAAMSIFALKNVAGWRDKNDITSNGKSFEDAIAELKKK
jgi:hypothetical protein